MTRTRYAIAFDVDTARMKDDGYVDTTFVYKEVGRALERCGFTEHLQGSVYSTNEFCNPIAAVVSLQTTLEERAPIFCKYRRKVHVFRLEDWSEVTYTLRESADVAANTNASRQMVLDLEEPMRQAVGAETSGTRREKRRPAVKPKKSK